MVVVVIGGLLVRGDASWRVFRLVIEAWATPRGRPLLAVVAGPVVGAGCCMSTSEVAGRDMADERFCKRISSLW